MTQDESPGARSPASAATPAGTKDRTRDRRAVALQLGREPRAMTGVASRCRCGLPQVVETWPRLADGSPFPTLFYLTCPRLASAIGTLESSGLMREMTGRLDEDAVLRERYEAAARDYVARRDTRDVLAGVPAQGGMPRRVKCLHALVAHSLAVGPGVNPFGDEALALLGDWAARGPCVNPDSADPDSAHSDSAHSDRAHSDSARSDSAHSDRAGA